MPRSADRMLVLLFASNFLTLFDRAMPTVVIEEIRADFGLTDTAIGVLAAALTIVYASAGIPLGRLADRRSRTAVAAGGLAVFSILTAASGLAVSFATLLIIRVGVSIGDAACAPAANALVGDLYPAERRPGATAVVALGLPLGLMLAYLTGGAVADAFGNWRAPFFLTVIPGLLVARALWRAPEPPRGAADHLSAAGGGAAARPLRRIAAVATVRRLLVAFLAYNAAAAAVISFAVPLLRRHWGLSLTEASITTGLVVGLTGLVGLTAGGPLADRATRRSLPARLWLGAGCLALAAPLTAVALGAGDASAAVFALVFGAGWLLAYAFYTCAYPVINDVVEPRLRATATAGMLALSALIGGAGGPLIVGGLSDADAHRAMEAAGATALSTAQRGTGLREAMLVVVPAALLLAAVSMLWASRSVERDRARMLARAASPEPSGPVEPAGAGPR